MITLTLLMTMLTAVALGVSDFRSRYVSLFSLIAYALSAVFYGCLAYGVRQALTYAAVGSSISLLIFVSICVYFRIREGVDSVVIDVKIGKGDLYFFILSTFIFEPFSLIVFYVASGVSGLIYYYLKQRDSIPLIGVSVPFVIIYILSKVLL